MADRGPYEAKPDCVKDEHLTYLDELRESGETNMFGAASYVQTEFGVDKKDAKDILLYWMRSFERRHGSEA